MKEALLKGLEFNGREAKEYSHETVLNVMEEYKMTGTSGAELIAIERQEQIEKHGRTVEEDVRFNTKGQLSVAAGILSQKFIPDNMDLIPKEWNEIIWNNMLRKPYKERLIIAGALIAAEIDRLNAE